MSANSFGEKKSKFPVFPIGKSPVHTVAMRSRLTEQILELEAGSHVCLLYDGDLSEQMAALGPFLLQGLARNEQCVYVVADQSRAQLEAELQRREIDVAQEISRNRLILWTREEWRQPGVLNSERKAIQVRQMIEVAQHAGFSGIRFAIEMGWTRDPDIGAAEIEHWEATISTLFPRDFPCRMICQYNRSRLPAAVILAALYTHPVVIVNGELCRNVFYQAPLILEGSQQQEDSVAARIAARVEWMIAQLRRTRAEEEQTQELRSQKRAQQRLALQWTTNDILSAATSFHEAGSRFLRKLCEEGEWEVGTFWSIERGQIKCAGFWQSEDMPGHGLETTFRAQSFACGVELPGYVWLEASQLWVEDFARAQNIPWPEAAARAGLRSACAFPVSIRHEVIGVVALFGRSVRPRDDEVLEMIVAASGPAGHFFERQRAEQKQRTSDERLRQLISLLPAGIYTCDLEGRITFYNRRAVELWGREPKLHDERERFCGCYKRFRTDGRPAPAAQSPMAVALATGKTFRNVQSIVERPDGARFTATMNIDPIFDGEQGKVSGAISVFQDITDLKRSENLLSSQNGALQLVISDASLEEIFTRLIRTVESESPGSAVAAILLLDADGRHLRHGAAPSLPAAYNEAIDGIEIGPQLGTCCAAAYRGEIVITPDIAGEAGWTELKHLPLELGFRAAWSMPILSSSGKVLGTFGTYFRECRVPSEQEKEIVAMLCKTAALAIERHQFEAERKRAAQEIERARDEALAAARAKDDFLAALSHELRTPLSPVLLLASEAALDQQLPEGLRADFDTIRKNVELEARLIDDLLDLTRITRGKLPVERRAIDPHSILQDAITTIRTEVEDKRIALRVNLGDGLPVVWGDPVRLQQVYWNVLKNAVKFTPAGGAITVETRVDLEKGTFTVRITDTGIGMNSAELRRIFDTFSQGDHAGQGGSHCFGGLGLGLAISRKLVELHDGRIEALSAGRNCGAEFIIELPTMRRVAGDPRVMVALEKPAERASGSPPFIAPGLSRGRILLVEDHAPTRTTLEHLLRRRHYEVVSAATLSEARALAEQDGITLLISDIGLPDGNGYELMAELRDRRGLKGIALSGYGMENDLGRSSAAGFAIHLIKPVGVQALDHALEIVEGASV